MALLMHDAVQSYKWLGAGLPSTPTCSRGIEIHVPRQRTCHGILSLNLWNKFVSAVHSCQWHAFKCSALCCYLAVFLKPYTGVFFLVRYGQHQITATDVAMWHQS
jgi:hypothetical protein